MDSKIRWLLSKASKTQDNDPVGRQYMNKAYGYLTSISTNQTPSHADGTVTVHVTSDAPPTVNQDVYILCADIAFKKFKDREIAEACLHMYFKHPPSCNQFLCLAYLCKADLLAPSASCDVEQLKNSVIYLLKAIQLAKENARYHFIVYNASVLYWRFARHFLKANFKRHLADSIQTIVTCLEEIDDPDHKWRAQLMITTIECLLDESNKTRATQLVGIYSTFIRRNVPALYKKIFGLSVTHQLCDPSKTQKDVKISPELSAFQRLCKLKVMIQQNESPGLIAEEYQRLLYLLTEDAEPPAVVLPAAQRRPSMTPSIQRERTGDDTSLSTSSQKDSRKSTKLLPQNSNVPQVSSKLENDNIEKPYILLEFLRLAIQQNEAEIAQTCINEFNECVHLIKDVTFMLEIEFAQCDLVMVQLGDKKLSYQQSIIDIRMQAISRCHEAVENAVRSGDPCCIQAGACTLWNLCLPMLTSGLRLKIREPLVTISQALQGVDSLLMNLRCQVHFELGKTEQDLEQIPSAIKHLTKALDFDDGNIYKERLEHCLKRLRLRSQLYDTPTRSEDQAAMIIEQARRADSGTLSMKRSLLVNVGQALAPDSFNVVLDSENQTKVATASRNVIDILSRNGQRADLFTSNVKKAEGHLRRFGAQFDRERASLWADLAKTARKQEVWDVCRVAARFCLLYDDDRWSPKVPTKELQGRSSSPKLDSDIDTASISVSCEKILFERDLLRILAEVNFINGEALIHLLRSEGVELGETPVPPVDRRKHASELRRLSDEPDWLKYCEWLFVLAHDAVACFLRAIEISELLEEPWLVCCSAAYIWNYFNGTLRRFQYSEVTVVFKTVYLGLKNIGHQSEIELFAWYAIVLAKGLIQASLPPVAVVQSVFPVENAVSAPSTTDKSVRKSATKSKPVDSKSKLVTSSTALSAEALQDVNKATEICDHMISLTNGETAINVVSTATRQRLLEVWTTCKQLQQVHISKAYGGNDYNATDEINLISRAIVALKMLELNHNGVMEFKDSATISEMIDFMNEVDWKDGHVELELWTRLLHQASKMADHASIEIIFNKIIPFANILNSKDKIQFCTDNELLSIANCLYGQSLMSICQGQNALRRQALHRFVQATRHSSLADHLVLTLQAARHFWNASSQYAGDASERELLREPFDNILSAIGKYTLQSTSTDSTEKNGKSTEVKKMDSFVDSNVIQSTVASESSRRLVEETKLCGNRDDDLTLIAYMYGVLFQSYADKQQWEDALSIMDRAILNMPKTNHRMLIFKHLVVVKATLGIDVTSSVLRFKDESPENLAQMWQKMALCSTNKSSQINAYQKAVEVLSDKKDNYLKIEILIEFSQWMHCNGLPMIHTTDMLHWALDILYEMSFAQVSRASSPKKNKPRLKSRQSSSSLGKSRSQTALNSAKSAARKTSDLKAEGSRVNSAEEKLSEMDSTANLIPVEKKAVIGVDMRSGYPCLDSLSDVRQLQHMFLCYCLLADIAGVSNVDHSTNTLMAYNCIMRIWKVSLSTSSEHMANIQRNSDTTGKDSAKGKRGKDNREALGSASKERPKRTQPLDFLPTTVAEWSCYDAPDEAVETFRLVELKFTAINRFTFSKPSLTLVYLNSCLEHLRLRGWQHLAFPLLAMIDLLSRDLSKNSPLKSLTHLRAMEICIELSLEEGMKFHEMLADYELKELDQGTARQEAIKFREKQAQNTREHTRQTTTSIKQNSFINLTEKKEKSVPHLGKKVGSLSLRQIWTDTATVLVRLALYQPARELLNEAYISARVFNDKELLVCINQQFACISYQERQFGLAVTYCQLATSSSTCSEQQWYHIICMIVDCNLAEANYVSKNYADVLEQCKRTLTFAIATLQRSLESCSSSDESCDKDAEKCSKSRLGGKGQIKVKGEHEEQQDASTSSTSFHRNRVNSILIIVAKLESKLGIIEYKMS